MVGTMLSPPPLRPLIFFAPQQPPPQQPQPSSPAHLGGAARSSPSPSQAGPSHTSETRPSNSHGFLTITISCSRPEER